MGAMTTQEMIDEVRASIGNRQDISDERITTWLNWSLHEVCGFHRKRAYTPTRFPSLEGVIIADISPREGELASGNSSTTFVLEGSNAEDEDDFYNNWAIQLVGYDESAAGQDAPEDLVGQFRYIVDYDGGTSTGTVMSEWDVTPDSYTEYELYTRHLSIRRHLDDPDTAIWAIEHVELPDGEVLERVEWRDLVGEDSTEDSLLGTPTKYARYGDNIFLDKYSDERLVLRVFYYAFPTPFDSDSGSETTELPAMWDEAIVLGAVYRAFAKLMEPEREQAAREQFEYEVVNRINTPQLEESSIKNRGLKVRFK